MPSIRRIAQVKDNLEIDLWIPDIARANALGLTVLDSAPGTGGHARLALKNQTPKQLAAILNARLAPDWADFTAFVTESGKLGFTNIVSPPTGESTPVKKPGTCYFLDGAESSDFSTWFWVAGTNAVQSTIKRSGAYAWHLHGYIETPLFTSTGAPATTVVNAISRVYFRFEEAPSADSAVCSWVTRSIRCCITTDKKLSITFGGLGSDVGTVALTPGTGYRVETYLRYTAGTGLSDFYARIYTDAEVPVLVDEVSLVGLSAGSFFIDTFALGGDDDPWAEDAYWDDLYVGSAPADPATDPWVGPGSCSKPNYATGDSATDNAWAASAGNKYDCVADNPSGVPAALDDATYVKATYPNFKAQTFTHNGGGGVSGYQDATSIKAIGYWGRMKITGNTVAMYRRLRQGATVRNSGASITESFLWEQPLFSDLDLDGAAWVEAAIDALEFGAYARVYTDTKEAWLSSCMLFVDYVPAVWDGWGPAAEGGMKTSVMIF
jgi:hypothetical protein